MAWAKDNRALHSVCCCHVSFFFFWDRVSLCSSGWLGTRSSPISASQVLGLQMCTTIVLYEEHARMLNAQGRLLLPAALLSQYGNISQSWFKKEAKLSEKERVCGNPKVGSWTEQVSQGLTLETLKRGVYSVKAVRKDETFRGENAEE
jgi:hypothetical protein